MTALQPYIIAVCELIPIINAFLVAGGHNPLPFSEADAYTAFSYILAIIAFVHTVWKNHNFTKAAKKAQAILERLKAKPKEDLPDDYFEGSEAK